MKGYILGVGTKRIGLIPSAFLHYFYPSAYDNDDETRQDDAPFSPSTLACFITGSF